MKRLAVLATAVALVVCLGAPAAAAPVFPASIPLPAGFYPEGIAVGHGHEFFVGSLLDGAIYRGDLRSGSGSVINPGEDDRLVVGLYFDESSGLLWGVGADAGTGVALLFDPRTGEELARVDVPGAFLNDLVVTGDAAYITDSLADVLWRIPVDARGRPAGAAEPIPLTGDFTFVTTGDLPINLNGIAASPDGSTLIAVHTTLGLLYEIDPLTGATTTIDLGGELVTSGDGLLLHGKTLYVVQNFLNQVAVVRLDPDHAAGEVTSVITSELFRVPTTAARFGNDLYLVNARFDVGLPPALGGPVLSLDYDVVGVPAR
jgi:sugar lactone lactonase YvrE